MEVRDFDNVPMMLLKERFDYYVDAHSGNLGWMKEQTLDGKIYECPGGYHVYILAKRESLYDLRRHGWKEADAASAEEILRQHDAARLKFSTRKRKKK